MNGLLHRIGGITRDDEDELRNPLSVLGPSQTRHAEASAASGSGARRPAPASADGHSWQYLIASSSKVGDHPSWALIGPPTEVVVANDDTPERVASALAEHGWSMLTTSPPAPTNEGTINYIFRRLIA
ncbi:MAG: hypothetical protein J2P58_09040 [Acidimicrobiaceae bacterium]|nr:hypothetical protein [Acidimicrobiaceae bacterium]